MNFKKLACSLLIIFQLIGCSTSGGIYKKDDAKDGEFSVGRTALTILGVAAAVAAAKGGGVVTKNRDMLGTTYREAGNGLAEIKLTGNLPIWRTVMAYPR